MVVIMNKVKCKICNSPIAYKKEKSVQLYPIAQSVSTTIKTRICNDCLRKLVKGVESINGD